jgi:integrase
LKSKPKRVQFNKQELPQLKSTIRQALAHQRAQLMFILYTGCRWGSIEHTRAEDIDATQGIWRVTRLKGRPEGTTLPLCKQAVRWFHIAKQVKELVRCDSDWLFVAPRSRDGRAGGSLYPSVKGQVPEFSPHTLRRFWSGALNAVGTPHMTHKYLMSHSMSGSSNVTEIYTQVDMTAACATAQQAADWIDEHINKQVFRLPDLSTS